VEAMAEQHELTVAALNEEKMRRLKNDELLEKMVRPSTIRHQKKNWLRFPPYRK
jgi:hypothetical protein